MNLGLPISVPPKKEGLPKKNFVFSYITTPVTPRSTETSSEFLGGNLKSLFLGILSTTSNSNLEGAHRS